MKHIGNIIRKYRNILGMSRKDLSDNICSEKYLYMIEKGKRTPSTEVTNLLGDKMGIDLFGYYEYIDCKEPIKVKEIMDQFNKFRRENELDSLLNITEKAMILSDFNTEPWKYEIELNCLSIKVLRDFKFEEAVDSIQILIEELELNKSNNKCLVNLYILLSTCFQMERKLEEAKKQIDLASEALLGKEKNDKYSQIMISFNINKITLYYLSGEMDSVIEEGMRLYEYENEICCHIRSHHTFFYLAFANYQNSRDEVGIDWFTKGLCAVLVRKREIDMYYLSKYEIFHRILCDKRIPSELVTAIKKLYNMD